MAQTIDHVQSEMKVAQILDLVRHEIRKSGLDDDSLQRIIERGGELQERIRPIFDRLSLKVGLVVSAYFELMTTISLPAVGTFRSSEKFAIGTQDGVRIGWLGDGFKDNFLKGAGKNEIDVPAQQLRVHKLRKGSGDGPIIDELGGKELVETSLATMFEAMKKQGTGKPGDLVVNGEANIFYVRDDTGTLRSVYCQWDADGGFWRVDAPSVSIPYIRFPGSQVFSR